MTCGKTPRQFIPQVHCPHPVMDWSVLTEHVKVNSQEVLLTREEKYLEQRARSERVSRGGEEGQSRKHICMGAPLLLWGGDKRAMGTRPRAAGSEGSIWASPLMAWALLLISILTQGSGEASREGNPGT